MDFAGLSPIPFENVFHLGFLVGDLPEAMRELGDTLGVSWFPPLMVAPSEVDPVPEPRLVFSTQGPPFIELIKGHGESGSLFAHDGGPRLHHFGLYVKDWRAEVRRLEFLGGVVERHGDAEGVGVGYV